MAIIVMVYNRDIIAKPDFAYVKDGLMSVVFVDGPDHDKDSVEHSDATKRHTLDLMGWKVFVVRYDDIEERVLELGKIVGKK
jgi:very-short-patch-repair endonuclease